MNLTITLSPKRIAFVLGGISLVLCVLSIALKAWEWEVGVDNTYWLYHTVRLFNVNREGNIPTWYTTMLLFSCAGLLAIIGATKIGEGERYRFHWVGLAFLFLFLCIDEAAAIHEKFTIPFQESYSDRVAGYLYFGWVLVGIPFVVIVGVLYVRFWWRLPMPTRWHFLLAAGVYLGGALVIEAISARQWYLHEGTSLKYSAIGTVEEFCEMAGLVIFVYGLLGYLRESVGSIEIRITA